MSIFEVLAYMVKIGLISKQEHDNKIQDMFDEAGI